MKSSRNTSTSGKPASGRRTPARKTKAKKKTTRTMPVWMRNTLALIVVGVFSLTFYYFVIRPYSYRWKECYGRKEYGVCIPCGYEVHGIDISHYQGNIDWKELKQNRETDFPLHFIFMKATEEIMVTILSKTTSNKHVAMALFVGPTISSLHVRMP